MLYLTNELTFDLVFECYSDQGIFSEQVNTSANIYINSIDVNNFYANGLFKYDDIYKQKALWVSPEFENYFLNAGIFDDDLPTWDPLPDGNGYQNTSYNIIIYNNYIVQ